MSVSKIVSELSYQIWAVPAPFMGLVPVPKILIAYVLGFNKKLPEIGSVTGPIFF